MGAIVAKTRSLCRRELVEALSFCIQWLCMVSNRLIKIILCCWIDMPLRRICLPREEED